jgi:endonuclease YncB( thermonuclease family)
VPAPSYPPTSMSTSSRLPNSVSIDIIDGDTVRSDGTVYRLVGFNTPESGLNAGCEKERMLAAKATQRLRQLVGAGNLQLEPVRCACQRNRRHSPVQFWQIMRNPKGAGPRRGASVDCGRIGRKIRLRPYYLSPAKRLVQLVPHAKL